MRECARNRDRRAKSAAPGNMAKDKKAKRSPKSAKKDKKCKRDEKTLSEAELKELQVAAVQERNRAKQNVERIKEKMQQYRSRASTGNQCAREDSPEHAGWKRAKKSSWESSVDAPWSRQADSQRDVQETAASASSHVAAPAFSHGAVSASSRGACQDPLSAV